MVPSVLRRLLAAVLVLASLALPASATWSIVCVNAVTGEVGVASATCLTNFNLKVGTPVIVVGRGAAAAQSLLDMGAANRMIIHDAFLTTNLSPGQILDMLKGDASFQSRQYGIVNFDGPPVTFTGRRAGAAASGRAGKIGNYVYAVQGNVLTDDLVVQAATTAFRTTKGDMGERLMAAMEAARAFGGDGRCSCDIGDPTGCGAPPPSFQKTAHVGYIIVARMGDQTRGCDATRGCAQGSYYLSLNVAGKNGQMNDPDPVFQLQDMYANWRSFKRGRPDGLRSSASTVQSLPADGVTTRTVTIVMRDIDNVPLTKGGSIVTVTTESGAPPLAGVGPVSDHGDGTYSFPLTAGTSPGTDRFLVKAVTGNQSATLWPPLEVRTDPVTPLHVGYDSVPAAAGLDVPFTINVPSKPGELYTILASLSGTIPGIQVGKMHVPLNPDGLTQWTLVNLSDPNLLPGMRSFLDATGRSEGAFRIPPGQLLSLAGLRCDWAGVVVGKGVPVATNAVGFDIMP
jgi:hypothetical protein